MNTNTDPRDTNGNPLIVGNHYHFRFRNRDLLKVPDPNQIENSNLSQHPSQFTVKTEEEIIAFENINFELYNIWPDEEEEIVYLYFSGRDENDVDIDLSEWEPEWADYQRSNIISTPSRPKKRSRLPTPKTTRKFDAKGNVLPLKTPSVVNRTRKRTRLTYGGKTRRKRRKKTRRKRRKKTRRKRRKTRRKKTRRKRRKKTRRKKRGGNGNDMQGIEMTETNKTYPQNQQPQNQPPPLHQRLNKSGNKTWKKLQGFFGLTPSKQLQEEYWKKHDEKIKDILDNKFK